MFFGIRRNFPKQFERIPVYTKQYHDGTLQCVARKLEHIVKENERKIEKERKIRELEQKRSEAFYELGVFMGQYKY